MSKTNMKIIIQVGLDKVRKRMPPVGGAITPKKGKGAYKRDKLRRADWD